MYKIFSFPTSIGLESTPTTVKGASIAIKRKKSLVPQLFTFKKESLYVKQLYMGHPLITTGLEGKEVLVRPLHLPLKKDKDIEAALTFQAEPLLPYAIDQALLAYQVLSKVGESTDLTLFAVRKEVISSHLETWKALKIEPEKISCIPAALSQFGASYLSKAKFCLILHLQYQEMTCVLLKEGKLVSAFSQGEGLKLLLDAQAKDHLNALPQTEEEWQVLEQQKSHLTDAGQRLRKEVTKMGYALAKESKGEAIEGIALTGEVAEWGGLSSFLIQDLPFSLLTCESTTDDSPQKLLSYAVPIGLALGSLSTQSQAMDFRQQEWSYPHPWKRLKKSLISYVLSMCLLCYAFYFFSQQYLHHQEDQLKQTYLDLLAGMHKSHEQFEQMFLAKNPQAHEAFEQHFPQIEQLSQENLVERLAFLQKELQATPDSFPLFANIPRVSDVLAWLNQQSIMPVVDDHHLPQTRLQIENFSYTMLKRPQQGKKQEKYQVKIELEFSSPTPKWAREFHDTLITPNEWVDPKGEVKWNSNRGKYKTSFFLKDKTAYPSS